MTKHAVLSASSAYRWTNCPGSIRLCEDAPKITTEHARLGSAAHSLAQRALEKGLDADVWLGTAIALPYDREGESIVVDEEMVEATQMYLDYVRARPGRLLIEQRFDLKDLNPPAPMYGTADVIVISDHDPQIECVDFKYGAGYAVPTVNDQTLYYLLGAVLNLRRRFRSMRATIVQPRAQHPDGMIRSYDLDWAALLEFKTRLLDQARATLAPNAPLSVGPWCRFCPALPTCPAQARNAVEIAQAEFDSVEPPALPPASALSRDQIALVLDRAELIEDWFRAVRAYVQDGLEAGGEFPGWKLVPKRAMRKWGNEEATRAWVEANQLGEDAYTEPELKSVAQMEKAIKPLKIKIPDSLVIKVSSGNNLVRETDPRPAVVVNPGSEFQSLPAPQREE